MGRKSKRQWQTVEIDALIDVGAAGLPVDDLVAGFMTADAADDNFIATSLEATYTFQVETAAEPSGVGPFHFGIAKSDYSSAEIEAWFENQAGFTRADLVAQELSRRHIKQIGVFMPEAVAANAKVNVVVNDGKPIKTRLNWRIVEGTRISMWMYNNGDVVVPATAGQDFNAVGHISGFWEN